MGSSPRARRRRAPGPRRDPQPAPAPVVGPPCQPFIGLPSARDVQVFFHPTGVEKTGVHLHFFDRVVSAVLAPDPDLPAHRRLTLTFEAGGTLESFDPVLCWIEPERH